MGTFSIWHILIILFVPISFGLYFLPTIIAAMRDHPQKVVIILLNVFLGWSGIAWIICLVWSLITPQQATTRT